jgi:hypothetical protein
MTMRKLLFAAVAALALPGAAFAHPATEQFIPIGQSPGSGAVQGRAQAVAEPSAVGGSPTVTVAAAGGAQSFVVGPNTRIYVDRSAQNRPNTLGTIADVRPERVIEVRLADPRTRVAEWIKVRP